MSIAPVVETKSSPKVDKAAEKERADVERGRRLRESRGGDTDVE